MMARVQDCAEVEIVELHSDNDGRIGGPIAPNEVRINGVPVLCAADEPIVVSPLSVDQFATVTLTLIVSKLTVTSERRPEQSKAL